jgi:putative acyl-CoA dehydrogenase
MHELKSGTGQDARLDRYVSGVESDLGLHLKHSLKNGGGESEGQARRLAEKLALAMQAVLLIRHSPTICADAFVSSRLAGDHGYAFGTLPDGVDVAGILAQSEAQV